MADVLANLIEKRHPRSIDEYDRALREVVQEIMLLALWRAKFFEHAAFYGGTALRILYGLERFSEDLDFSLLRSDTSFSLTPYFGAIERELAALGLEALVESKKEGPAIESAFLKLNTRTALIAVGASELIRQSVPSNRRVKIKFEVDLDPPGEFSTEARYLLEPVPFSVKAFTASSLFAGKVHALLVRRWNNRVKGRDWYDFVFFVSRGTDLDIRHLEARLRGSGHWAAGRLSLEDVRLTILDRIESLDIAAAREEVERFLVDPREVEIWSKDFYRDLVGRIQC
jgi:hypothetical protein